MEQQDFNSLMDNSQLTFFHECMQHIVHKYSNAVENSLPIGHIDNIFRNFLAKFSQNLAQKIGVIFLVVCAMEILVELHPMSCQTLQFHLM